MRVARSAGSRPERIELAMTPMIDVVFQLLIFFMLALKIFTPEGDFAVKMPLGPPQPTETPPMELPPLRVRLTAATDGRLAAIRVGERSLGRDFFALRAEVRNLVADVSGPGGASDLEVELDCDEHLRYEYTMEAITAVSGYSENGRLHHLVEQIRFVPPRR